MNSATPIAIAALSLGLTACATYPGPKGVGAGTSTIVDPDAQARRQAFVRRTPGLSNFDKRAILQGRLRQHMSATQVKASWGNPQHVQFLGCTDNSGSRTEWEYGTRDQTGALRVKRDIYLIDDEVFLWYVYPDGG